jgi:hypothetical protein
MNLDLLVMIKVGCVESVLVDFVLRFFAIIGGESIIPLHGAAKEDTEVLVQVSQKDAKFR